MLSLDAVLRAIHARRRHSLDQRNKVVRGMQFVPPPRASWKLHEIIWDVPTLRWFTHQMLKRCHIGPNDLLRAWDQSNNGVLDRREFTNNWHAFFRDADAQLWEEEVCTRTHE